MTQKTWTDKISNPAQLGGIETAVMDDGRGRGTRIAWVNTGTAAAILLGFSWILWKLFVSFRQQTNSKPATKSKAALDKKRK